ncbi:TPA: hypothetical protein ACKRNJ_001954 [Pseudomonas aeruginosa]
MTESKICTCPSGDGSLRWPCPKHPAVEQAGGDERAVDGKPRATKCPDCGEGDLMPGDLCACGYETDPAAGYACSECDGSGDGYVGEVCRECDGSGWFVTPEQARAALAQPSPKCATCNGTGLIDDGEITCSEGGIPYENGPVKCVKDCPACKAQPSPLQAEQPTADDYEEVLADHRRLVRELDVLLNGEEGAAKQASLCDLVGQVSAIVRERRVPLLSRSQAEGAPVIGCLCGMPMTGGHHSPDGCSSLEEFAPHLSAQAQAKQAERPEVVAYRTIGRHTKHQHPHYALNYYKQNAEDQAAHWRERGCEVSEDELMTVSQHERIVGALRAEIAMLRSYEAEWELLLNEHEQQRDDALARVAELERQEPVATVAKVPGEDWNSLDFHRDLQDMQPGTKLYAAPVAQAQHSVPEGWMLVECGIWTQEQVDEMQKTVTRFRNSEFVDDRALAMAVADAGQCKAPEISLAELLAAAPVCRLSRSALTDAQMRRLYENSTETENERLGFEAFARLIRRAEAVHQITAAPGKEGV